MNVPSAKHRHHMPQNTQRSSSAALSERIDAKQVLVVPRRSAERQASGPIFRKALVHTEAISAVNEARVSVNNGEKRGQPVLRLALFLLPWYRNSYSKARTFSSRIGNRSLGVAAGLPTSEQAALCDRAMQPWRAAASQG